MPISFVKEDNILGKDIYDEKGRTLLSQNTKLTNRYIEKIKSLGIYSLYIKDKYSDVEINDIISPKIKNKAMITIKDTYKNFQENYNDNNKYSKEIIDKTNNDISNISSLAEKIIDDILSQKDVVVNIIDIKSSDNYTYQHSLNVSILSIILGLELELDKKHLKYLAIGALLHDIGKTLIPKDILFKKGPLTDEEFKIMKSHSLKGYNYLKISEEIPSPSRIIAIQHHEKIDGSGYPNGLKDKDIYFLSKIVAIADVYDALTSDRPYRNAMSPNEALEYLYSNCTKQFDIQLVKKFSNRIIPYPIGSMVKLSNGDKAIVKHINKGFPLRPKVQTINNNKSIDLILEKNIVIEKTIYNN